MSEPTDLLLEPVSEEVVLSLFAEADARVNSGGGTVPVDALLIVRLIAQLSRLKAWPEKYETLLKERAENGWIHGWQFVKDAENELMRLRSDKWLEDAAEEYVDGWLATSPETPEDSAFDRTQLVEIMKRYRDGK